MAQKSNFLKPWKLGVLGEKPQTSGSTLKELKLFGLDPLLENLERFPFKQNFRKFGNSGKWYRNFWILEFLKCEPFNRKFWEKSWMERKLPGKKFSKIWVYPPRLSSFWEIFKKLFYSLLKVDENSNQTFWLNEKRPWKTVPRKRL